MANVDERLSHPIDCTQDNCLRVDVILEQEGQADITILGGPERNGPYFGLEDPSAQKQAVTSNTSFDVAMGSAWAVVRLTNARGCFTTGRGFTITARPYTSLEKLDYAIP